jgi:hypothetical protein
VTTGLDQQDSYREYVVQRLQKALTIMARNVNFLHISILYYFLCAEMFNKLLYSSETHVALVCLCKQQCAALF